MTFRCWNRTQCSCTERNSFQFLFLYYFVVLANKGLLYLVICLELILLKNCDKIVFETKKKVNHIVSLSTGIKPINAETTPSISAQLLKQVQCLSVVGDQDHFVTGCCSGHGQDVVQNQHFTCKHRKRCHFYTVFVDQTWLPNLQMSPGSYQRAEVLQTWCCNQEETVPKLLQILPLPAHTCHGWGLGLWHRAVRGTGLKNGQQILFLFFNSLSLNE